MIYVKDFSDTGLADGAAINAAIAQAHKAADFVQLEAREYKVDDAQIVINEAVANCKGICGCGKGISIITSGRAQTQVWNANTNKTDARPDAVILVDGVDGRVMSDFSVKYTGEFFRSGDSYFGAVSGILFANCSDSLAERVEVSGCNRNGICFVAYGLDTKLTQYYKGQITIDAIGLPKNNRAVACHTHHNRVAGILFQHQDGGVAQGNLSEYNGHPSDGGTGYGIVASSGSVNRVSFLSNTTNHNYRKGLDSHDAVSFVAHDNILLGDRLFGFAVENRQYPCELVDIRNNEIHQDPTFRLEKDDDLAASAAINLQLDYYRYTAIRVELKSQPAQTFKNWIEEPEVNIVGNRIYSIKHDGRGSHRLIEIRNNDKDICPVVNVLENTVNVDSLGYFVAAFGSAATVAGLGKLSIIGNQVTASTINECPIYLEERNTSSLKGEVVIRDNEFSITTNTGGATKFGTMQTNAEKVDIGRNKILLMGTLDRPVLRLLPLLKGTAFNFSDNEVASQSVKVFTSGSFLQKGANLGTGLTMSNNTYTAV